MENSSLSISDFERAMAALFSAAEANRSRFADSDFDKISRLLAQVGKPPQWCYRPRTYTVLRMIDRIDLFDIFISDSLKDIAFPYTNSRLPNSLSPTVKAKFLQAQNLVLTKAFDLGKSDGRHRHLDQDADAYFSILKILGRGGFGEVHHVRSKLSLEEYARKRVHRKKAFSKDREAIKVFENELINLKRLSHHHLVKLVGSYTDPKFVGLLMSPVADCDLKAFLERDPFPKDGLHLLRGFFGCLCSTVLYLHNSECRHKDLKPGNTLIYGSNVLITDFETARDWSGHSRSTTTGRSGAFTPGYAAPEVVNEEPRKSSADIWSLGCIYLDMMTVLRGETLVGKNQFFAENGTGGANPCSNAKALELWLERLKSEMDKQPLEWIKLMIKNAPNERITAAGLMDRIHNHEGDYVYYNSCCNGEEESDSGTSYQGSIWEEGDSANRDSENPTETRMDDRAANSAMPTSGWDLNEISTHRRAYPLGSLNTKNQIQSTTVSQHPNIALERAITDAQTIQLLLDNGFDIQAKSFRVQDALLWAVQNGHEVVAQLLVEKGADVEATDNDGGTALHWAARNGNEAVVQLLVEKGVDIKAMDSYGETALHWAARNGHEAVVQLLVEKGADVEATDKHGRAALHRAAQNGHKVVVQLLVEKGADVKTTSNSGRTALHWAAQNGHEVVVQLLVEKGADIKATSNSGGTALHRAAQNGHRAVVRLLVEKEADVEATDNYGETALHWAARNGHEVVVQLLVEKGADFKATDREYGGTALHRAARNGHEAVVQLLVEKGADVEATVGNNGGRALHLAAWNGHEAVVQLLVEKGADVKATSNSGKTALHWAAQYGHRAVVQLLVEKGADVKATDNYGETALHWAARNGREAVVRLLVEKGADVKAMDNYGETALHWAARNGYEAVLQLLVEKGADIKATDREHGRTALHRAARNGYKAVVQLLNRQ